MRLLRGSVALFWLTFDRLLWSSATLTVLVPLVICGILVHRWWSRARFPSTFEAFDAFSTDFVFGIFAGFIVPVCALAYGTTSIGSEREDRTLLFVLLRPIPRPVVLLVKVAATLPLVLGAVVASYYIYCQEAGAAGELAFRLYLPTLVGISVTYVALFHLFAVVFRHATIAAIIYALFIELVLGNTPGIIKRLAISFYGRSIMMDVGVEYGVAAPPENWFAPVQAETGGWALLVISLASLAVAVLVFQQREYREVT